MSGQPLLSAPETVKQGTLVEPRGRKKPVLPRPSATQRLTPQLVIYAISRWWLTALILGILLGVSGAVATSFLIPRIYRASAWLQIESQRQILAYDLPDSKGFVRTQLALLKSPLVLNPVLENETIKSFPEIQTSSAPRKLLEKGLSIQSVDNSDLYQVHFDSPHKDHAAVIADAIVKSYFEQKSSHFDDRTEGVINKLQEELVERRKALTELRKKLLETAKHVTGEDTPLVVNPEDANLFSKMHGPLAELQNRLSRVEVERQILQARLQAANGATDAPAPEGTSVKPTTLMESDATLQRLQLRLGDIETRITAARQVNGWGEEHPRLRLMISEQNAATEAIEERRDFVKLRVEEELRGRKVATAEELKQQIAAQDVLEATLREQIAAERNRLEGSDDQSMELTFQRLDLQRAEDVYNLMASRVLAMTTEKEAPDRVLEIKPAADNDVIVYSEPIPKVAAVFALGLLAPFALAVFAEFRLQRITHGDQLALQADMPVIAEISRIPLQTLRNSRSSQFETRKALFEESIDQLRSSLMVPDELQSIQVLATVSAVSGEGKSSIASQLAISLARACHEPVLLIDGDTRSPSLQDIFEIKMSPGVVDILQGRCDLTEATQQLNDLLYLVPAGELDINPHALITPGGFRKLLDAARPHYRYIIVDCPPVLAASEAFVLAKSADAAVMCAMRDVSRGHQVKKACSRLHSVGVRTLGVILSGVPTFDYRYRYGSYYYGQHRRDDDSAHANGNGRENGHPFANGSGRDPEKGFYPGRRPTAK